MTGRSLPSLAVIFTIICFGSACHKDITKYTQHKAVEPSFNGSRLKKSKSQLLTQSGEAKIGEPMPFFSGWTSSTHQSEAYSLKRALSHKKSRYVLTVCAAWCKPCIEGLEKLSSQKKTFLSREVELIVLVADQSQHARDLNERFDLSWAYVLVDEFHTFALKLAPSRSNKGGESLSLPRTIVFNANGVVEKIIATEGEDYVTLIFSP